MKRVFGVDHSGVWSVLWVDDLNDVATTGPVAAP